MTAALKEIVSPIQSQLIKQRLQALLQALCLLTSPKDEDQQAVFSWLRQPAVRGIFLASPCGTASAAGSIDIAGERPPQPLRSLEEPDGISGLSGTDLTKVSAANILCAFCAEVLELCCELDNCLCWKTQETLCFG